MDSILLSEIRRVHELIRAEEKHLSVEVKKTEHMTFVEHCEMLLHLSNVARKEGLLALEQAGEKFVSCEEQDFAKEIILMIVDGCFPQMVKKVSLLKYFSTEQNAYQAIKNLMTIYALLAVQDGENPRNIVRMMKGMLPGDVHNEVEHLNDGTSFFLAEQVNQELDLEAYCNGELRIKECDLGYFETKLCEDMLLSLENRAMQRLLRDIDSYDLQRAMNVFSGKGRKHIFENLSTRKGKELESVL